MAAELLVIGNPTRRKGRRARKSKVRRNPARKRRTLTAAQAKYFGPGRRKAKKAGRRRARSAALSTGAVAVRRRRVRRNPISMGGFKPEKFINQTLMPAGVGAAGALALDVALGYAAPHLPASLTTGSFAPTAVKLAGAVGLGMVAQMVTKDRAIAERVTAGAVTVVLYGVVKKLAAQQFPTVPGLQGMGMYVHGMGYAGAARQFPDGMGMYVPGGQTAPALPPALVAAMAQRANPNNPPPGLHGDGMSEGGYSYN